MQNSQFERLLKLAQRTGDRLIVTDPSGREPVVILPLSEYEGLLDHKSFRGGGEDQDHEEGAYDHVRKPQAFEEELRMTKVNRASEEMEGEFDPAALEEQVRAAMVMDEPEMVPVQPSVPSREEFTPEEDSRVPSSSGIREEPRKPIVRRNAPKEGGEEQFYLESV